MLLFEKDFVEDCKANFTEKFHFCIFLGLMEAMDSSIRVGIVSTMRGPEFTLESWILWHSSLGIKDFYIFFDDPKDSAISIAQKYQPVYNVRKCIEESRFQFINNILTLNKLMEGQNIQKRSRNFRIEKEAP